MLAGGQSHNFSSQPSVSSPPIIAQNGGVRGGEGTEKGGGVVMYKRSTSRCLICLKPVGRVQVLQVCRSPSQHNGMG